jgi:tetratricopeptide (TPR) repeat protein
MPAPKLPPASSENEDLKAFQKLFWAARNAHRKAGKSARLDDPAHVAALRHAKARAWPWATTLLTALWRSYRDDSAAALAEAQTLTVPATLEGERQFVLAVAHHGLKQWIEAIICYQRALAADGFGGIGYAWNNLGNVHAAKKDFAKAIAAYEKALATPGYDTPGDLWNNLGSAHAGKADFEQAIAAYEKALATPGYDAPHLIRLNRALVLLATKHLSEARRAVEQVLAESDSEAQHERAKFILSLIEAEEREIVPKPDEIALVAPSPPDLAASPEGNMIAAILRRENRYDEYLKKTPAVSLPDDLTILRGWSSSVTLLEGSRDGQWRGGGYFLKWRGHGLVIDPGFDFLDNFHDAGFHGTEISAVVVSHNHPDHNYDLISLDNLCYELFRKAPKPSKTLFALDEDTAKTFPDDSPAHRGSACKLTRADSERKRWLGGFDEKLPFTIEHFPVSHGSDVSHAVGLRIRLHPENSNEPDIVVGYTGDGEFTDDLGKQLRGVDLLLAHVSQPDVAEFNDSSVLKKVHLGYNGLIRLIREAKPSLTLVGEFWAGLADLRLDLIAGIRLRSGSPAVLPACLGLRLRLKDFTVRCTRSGKQVPAAMVKVAPPLKEFGELGYLSPDSII